jgi:hypothetical protein
MRPRSRGARRFLRTDFSPRSRVRSRRAATPLIDSV